MPSDVKRNEETADALRRKLLFRSRHRGSKELDLILGPFADSYVAAMSLEELSQFALLLEQSDPDIYDWLVGRETPSGSLNTPVLQKLLAFNQRTRPR